MRAIVVLVVLTAAASLTLSAERPAPTRAVPGDAQDLVLFQDTRPFLIRLHLQINGQSFRGAWEETMTQLFRYLDADGDGALNAKEAALAPSKSQWVQFMTGAALEPDSAPELAELAGSTPPLSPPGKGGNKGGVTHDKFSLYYRQSGAGALQIEWGWRPPDQDQLSTVLFGHLDKDKDGSLSREELLAARNALRPLDINGDDLIAAAELTAENSLLPLNFRSAGDERPKPANFPFVLVEPDAPAPALADSILKRYDRDKDGKLSRNECQFDKAVFDRLDANHDDRLDSAELAGWKKLPPDMEFLAALEPGARKDILLLPDADGKPNRLTAMLPPSRDGNLRIPLAGRQLEVARGSRGAAARRELLKQFDAQAGKDGFLAEKQIYQPPFTFVAMLRLADRDGDNRLSRKELADYLEVQEKFLFRTSHLTVVDRGASLFEFIDADHDGRLCPRELQAAWKRLSAWDHDKTGRITRKQVPRQFQLVLSYGQWRADLPAFGPGFADLPMLRDRSRGPLWFRKMDRNGDGDVSRAEFLGTVEQFRKIDSDDDGLIDVSEAERADKELRKGK
jgi:Ca2+-binding EF-hand superfamily protein